jgi:hypothetical protein
MPLRDDSSFELVRGRPQAIASRDQGVGVTLDLARQALDQASSPEIHRVSSLHRFGDVYRVCWCGAMSLPYHSEFAASGWVCPRETAELAVGRNAKLYADRVELASSVIR